MKSKIFLIFAYTCIILIALTIYLDLNRTTHKDPDALYFACIKVIDIHTNKAISPIINIDVDSISRYAKGAEPAIKQHLDNGTIIISCIGRTTPNGLRVRISSEGYSPKIIHVPPHTGSVLTLSQKNMTIVELSHVPED